MRPPIVGASGPGPGGPNVGAATSATGAAAAAAAGSSTAKKAAEAASAAASKATTSAQKTFFASVSDRLAKDSVTLKSWWSLSAAYMDDLKTGHAKITMPVHVRERWNAGREERKAWRANSKAGEKKPRRRRTKNKSRRALALTQPLVLVLKLQTQNSKNYQVDVDFFGPMILAAKREGVRAWRKLPPPAQQAAPYVATAAASGGSTYAWQRRRFIHERARGDLLAARVKSLASERVKLQDACKALRAAAASPRAAADVRSAEAVAAATGAAAAAAAAAAEAAKACAVYVTRVPPSSRRTPEN